MDPSKACELLEKLRLPSGDGEALVDDEAAAIMRDLVEALRHKVVV